MMRAFCLGFTLALWATAAAAFEPELPTGARLLSDRDAPLDSYRLSLGPFLERRVPGELLEGRVHKRSWRVPSPNLTTLQVLIPLREQLIRDGFMPVFECDAPDCGGFDFRFAIDVIPAPGMFVDIRNYRYLAARDDREGALSLLISRSREAIYLQMVEVTPRDTVQRREDNAVTEQAPLEVPANSRAPVEEAQTLGQQLGDNGRVVLDDLDFGSGDARLGPGPFASLQYLANFLAENPALRVAIVGHTDNVGSLARNIALSKRRAEAVRERLMSAHGVEAARVDAEGMGYLAPLTSNLTLAGREANRRVEVILLAPG